MPVLISGLCIRILINSDCVLESLGEFSKNTDARDSPQASEIRNIGSGSQPGLLHLPEQFECASRAENHWPSPFPRKPFESREHALYSFIPHLRLM